MRVLRTLGFALKSSFCEYTSGGRKGVERRVNRAEGERRKERKRKGVRSKTAGQGRLIATGTFISCIMIWYRYYRIFTSLYATSLLFSEHIMTNSSWTQAHIKTLLTTGRSSFLASIVSLGERSIDRKMARGELRDSGRTECEVAYPPCDTVALVELGNLDGRKREIVSLAQFR